MSWNLSREVEKNKKVSWRSDFSKEALQTKGQLALDRLSKGEANPEQGNMAVQVAGQRIAEISTAVFHLRLMAQKDPDSAGYLFALIEEYENDIKRITRTGEVPTMIPG